MLIYTHPEGDDQFLETQWAYLLRAFAVSPVSREGIGGTPVVVFQPKDGRYVQGETSLENFTHLDDAVYYFGHSHKHMPQEDLAGLNVVAKVYIEVDEGTELFSNQAGCIVLWDRRLKQNGQPNN